MRAHRKVIDVEMGGAKYRVVAMVAEGNVLIGDPLEVRCVDTGGVEPDPLEIDYALDYALDHESGVWTRG